MSIEHPGQDILDKVKSQTVYDLHALADEWIVAVQKREAAEHALRQAQRTLEERRADEGEYHAALCEKLEPNLVLVHRNLAISRGSSGVLETHRTIG